MTIQSLLSSHVLLELIKTQTVYGGTTGLQIAIRIKIKNEPERNLLYFDLAYYDCALCTHNDVQRTKANQQLGIEILRRAPALL